MINPYYFINEKLKIGFKPNLESHNINHVNSILNITPNYPDFGIETIYIFENLKVMATFYAKLINQYKFNNEILFSASFYKNIEEDERSDEIELFINLNNNENLTESNIDNIDVISQSEHQNIKIKFKEQMKAVGSLIKLTQRNSGFIKLVKLTDLLVLKIF